MALVPLSQLDDYDLVNSDQDCRGWAVRDAAGNQLGTVREMVVNTDSDLVSHLILEDGREIPARNVSLADNTVIVRGMDIDTTSTRRDTGTPGAPGVGATAAAASAGARTGMNEGEVALPVIEEEIRVGKRTVEKGGVRVRTRVEEVPVEEQIKLREETVHVERRPVNRSVTDADAAAVRGGVIEVTEVGEEAVVAKQARVVEEVVVGKEVVEHQETVRDTVRRTDVEVEQMDADPAGTKKKSKR